ncbi:hypothetical protein [Changpingibacter yushuensis]|uniref:hypothetical protein n=1 Tax=Changpingibacter yushuensis TaxID=2758440 RepID=UPI0015F3FEF8|nr:hypothetical protein [Changpingibacter yushuensis]
MNPTLQMQRLARMGIAMALGALALGVLGTLMVWMDGTGTFSGLAIILLVPGVLLLVSAGYLIFCALRSDPRTWVPTYTRVSQVLTLTAIVSGVAVIVAAILINGDASALQTVLVAIVGLQGPIATYMISTHVAEIASKE